MQGLTLPGHWSTSIGRQSLTFTDNPVQVWPPLAGGGFEHSRRLWRVFVWQSQGLHSPHAVQDPFTEKWKYKDQYNDAVYSCLSQSPNCWTNKVSSPGEGHSALEQGWNWVSTSWSLHWSRHHRVLTLLPEPQEVEQSLQEDQLPAPHSSTSDHH